MIDDCTAIVVTRGDVDMGPILEVLHANYEDVVVWDNSQLPNDQSVFGRYAATFEATTDLCYFQDDDIIFHDHERLRGIYDEYCLDGRMLCNMDKEWVERGQYHDVGLLGMGGLMQRFDWMHAVEDYLTQYPPDKFFLDWCDFVVGVLNPHLKVDLGYEVRDVARFDGRLATTPGNRVFKNAMINRARYLRG